MKITFLFIVILVAVNLGFGQINEESYRWSGKTKYFTESIISLLYKSKDSLIIHNSFGPSPKVEKVDFYKAQSFELIGSIDIKKSKDFAPIKENIIKNIFADNQRIYILSTKYKGDDITFYYSTFEYKNPQSGLKTKEFFTESKRINWEIEFDTLTKSIYITGDASERNNEKRSMYYFGSKIDGTVFINDYILLPVVASKSDNEFKKDHLRDKQGFYYFKVDNYTSGINKAFGENYSSTFYQYNPITKKTIAINIERELSQGIFNVKFILDKSDNLVMVGNYTKKGTGSDGFMVCTIDKFKGTIVDTKKYDFSKLKIPQISEYSINDGMSPNFRVTNMLEVGNGEKIYIIERLIVEYNTSREGYSYYTRNLGHILIIKLNKSNEVVWSKWIPRFERPSGYSLIGHTFKVVSNKIFMFIGDISSFPETLDINTYESKENKRNQWSKIQLTIDVKSGEINKKIMTNSKTDVKKSMEFIVSDFSIGGNSLFFNYLDKGDLYRKFGFYDIK